MEKHEQLIDEMWKRLTDLMRETVRDIKLSACHLCGNPRLEAYCGYCTDGMTEEQLAKWMAEREEGSKLLDIYHGIVEGKIIPKR